MFRDRLGPQLSSLMIQLGLWRYEGAMALEAKTVDVHLVAKVIGKEKITRKSRVADKKAVCDSL